MSSRGEIHTLQMEFIKDLELSFIVQKGKREVFIPRSLVTYRRKWSQGDKTMIEFNLPAWKVMQDKLGDYITD